MADEVEREVEWTYCRHDSDGHSKGEAHLAGPGWRSVQRNRLTVKPLCLLGREADRLDGPGYLCATLADYLALFHRDRACKLLRPLLQQVGGPVEYLVAAVGRKIGHGRRTPDGAGHRSVDVLDSGPRDGIEDIAVVRVHDGDLVVSVYPFSADGHPHWSPPPSGSRPLPAMATCRT